jgi:hypothetical protein
MSFGVLVSALSGAFPASYSLHMAISPTLFPGSLPPPLALHNSLLSAQASAQSPWAEWRQASFGRAWW